MMKDKVIKSSSPKTKLSVLDAIAKRFSPRVFSKSKITNEEIETIFEAARLAPSARNHQPWKFYLIRKESESYSKLESCIPERNLWATSASVFIIASYDPTEPKDGVNKWAQYDLGAACISLIIQAQELDCYSRQIGSFDASKAKELLNIEDPYIPFVLIAMGKIGSKEDYNNTSQDIIDKELSPWSRKDKVYEELD